MLNQFSIVVVSFLTVVCLTASAGLLERPISCGGLFAEIGLDLHLATVEGSDPKLSQVIAYYRAKDGQITKQGLWAGKILTAKVTSGGYIVSATSDGLVQFFKFDGTQFNYEQTPVDWAGVTPLRPGSLYTRADISDNLAYAAYVEELFIFDKDHTSSFVTGTKLAVHIHPLKKGGFIKSWHPDLNLVATVSDIQSFAVDNDGKVFLQLKSGKTFATAEAGDIWEKD